MKRITTSIYDNVGGSYTKHCIEHDRFYSSDLPCPDCLSLAEMYQAAIDKTAAQESSTGSLRFNAGKPQCNEIDPAFILGMGAVLEKSRVKYPRGNWAKGNDFSVPFDSMMRHLLAWQSGASVDSESGLSHLHHAALNLMMLAYYETNFPEFDDRLFKKEKK